MYSKTVIVSKTIDEQGIMGYITAWARKTVDF